MGYEAKTMRSALTGNSYPGRGIVVGKSADGAKAFYAYFIMGRSENSRNRIFVEEGDNVTLYPGVKIYHSCVIGNNCTLHAGVVIGADGFGFAPQANGEYAKIAQIGNVILEENVEVGANTTIDRATMGSTIIRKGVKLDNLIQIAHNVEVGEHTVIAAQAGIAGSAKVGSHAMIGGQVGVAGHIRLGDRIQVGAQSGIPNHVDDDAVIMGYPAVPSKEFARQVVYIKRLPDLTRTVKELSKEIESLKEQLKNK